MTLLAERRSRESLSALMGYEAGQCVCGENISPNCLTLRGA
jgi:hypothetical protein